MNSPSRGLSFATAWTPMSPALQRTGQVVFEILFQLNRWCLARPGLSLHFSGFCCCCSCCCCCCLLRHIRASVSARAFVRVQVPPKSANLRPSIYLFVRWLASAIALRKKNRKERRGGLGYRVGEDVESGRRQFWEILTGAPIEKWDARRPRERLKFATGTRTLASLSRLAVLRSQEALEIVF